MEEALRWRTPSTTSIEPSLHHSPKTDEDAVEEDMSITSTDIDDQKDNNEEEYSEEWDEERLTKNERRDPRSIEPRARPRMIFW